MTEIPLRRKLQGIKRVVSYRPAYAVGVLVLSILASVLEGVGLSFILPIVEKARGTTSSDPGRIMGVFVRIYDTLGVPFTMEYIIIGVGVIIATRYALTFIVAWLRARLQIMYIGHLRSKSFKNTLDAKIGYFDTNGTDDILNAIITQTQFASRVIERLVGLFQESLLALVYLSVAFYLAPRLTVVAALIVGGGAFLSRWVFESGYAIGDRFAEANERVQTSVQNGTEGIREVKMFGIADEIYSAYSDSMDTYIKTRVEGARNSVGISNLNQLISALSVFVLIYLALEFSSLSLGSLGVFLFAMFKLSPKISAMNNLFYKTETDLAHLIRAQDFIDELESEQEIGGSKPAPDDVEEIVFDDVSFSYDGSEYVLKNVSLEIKDGENVAFVGESGAGKSTIISLLSLMYRPDSGTIRINGTPIEELDTQSWRRNVSFVRQDPYIFNDTLEYNITIGNRKATKEEIEVVAEMARVSEFIDDLPEGYNTVLGDDGVRLSGGQKQRVAIARALLEESEILLLDEATSELDTNIEAEVYRSLEQIDPECITISVAHDLHTIKNSERIYVVEDGEITEAGEHQKLLDDSDKYRQLYKGVGD